jgi:dUTP pyrophosphatase
MLNREEIRRLIEEKKLVQGYIDLQTQLTPNGFDVTACGIFEFSGQGRLDFSNKERQVAAARLLSPSKENVGDKFGWWDLPRGTYKVRSNETVSLPNDLIALAFSRTSLLRMGAFTEHGVWDAGFHGKAEFLLAVDNPSGIRLKENARVAQLVFVRINATRQGYAGVYQDPR